MNIKIKKSFLSLAMAGVLMTSYTSNCFATAFPTVPFSQNSAMSQEFTAQRSSLYQITENCAVKDSPSKYAKTVRSAEEGLYVPGEMILNSKGHKWLSFYTEDGELAYIYEEHLTPHKHDYYTAVEYGGEEAGKYAHFDVCDCGYCKLTYDSGYYKECDLDDVVCHLAYGSYADSSNTIADAITLGYDVVNVGVCQIPHPYAKIACAALTLLGRLASVRDFTADTAHKNYLKAAIDAAGIGLDFATDLKPLEENRLVKYLGITLDSSDITQDYLQLHDDISESLPAADNIIAPSGILPYGNVFCISADFHFKNNAPMDVTCCITNDTGDIVYSYTESQENDFALLGSAYDNEMRFNDLAPGNYYYAVYGVHEYDNGVACMMAKVTYVESDFTIE